MKKEAEMFLEYKDITIELMWNVKTKLIAVKIGATGNVSKSFRKCLNSITGTYDSRELQATVALGTVLILRKAPM